MNKKGMTLLELIVYIVLASFLLAPVIMLVHKSSMEMARDNSSSTLRTVGRDVMNIIFEDLKNTGYKAKPSAGTYVVDSAAFYPATDRSSFLHVDGVPNDELTIKKGVLDASGNWTGVDSVRFYVDADKVLWRQNYSDGSNQKVVFGVEALQITFADSTFNWIESPTAAQKRSMKNIRVMLLLRDEKQLSVTGTETFNLTSDVTLSYTDKSLRELYQLLVPVPNNGLFF